jgi:hypothetical protein
MEMCCEGTRSMNEREITCSENKYQRMTAPETSENQAR